MKIIVAELHSALGSRSTGARFLQKSVMQVAKAAMPSSFLSKLAWDAYQKADAFVANTAWEASLMRDMFGAEPDKVHVVPNGVEDVFFQSAAEKQQRPEGKFLVCTAVIHPRKRVVELARAAVQAKVPVWIVGKPYSESDPYYVQFLEVQKHHPDLIRYEGSISDRAQLAEIYKQARGFVLLSTQETLSLSSFEAAAAKCPLLLSDLPWARTAFGTDATYADGTMHPDILAPVLRSFYEKAPSIQTSFRPLTWPEVGELFKAVYVTVLN